MKGGKVTMGKICGEKKKKRKKEDKGKVQLKSYEHYQTA